MRMISSSTISLEVKNTFLSLVRLGIGHDAQISDDAVDWNVVKSLADKQELSAIVLDGIEVVKKKMSDVNHNALPPKAVAFQWYGQVLQNYVKRYEMYKRSIAEMAAWHKLYGFKMMVLKGYACSLDWPQPNHRPCGDIDIWQFGRQKEADAALSSWFKEHGLNFSIDSSHHHHTVFKWRYFMVENHYDFLNVHHHKSNVALEAILKELGDECHTESTESTEKGKQIGSVEIYGQRVYLPSANLHALFLLRHTMSNFASTGMLLRQLLDWGFLVEKHAKEIDWQWLETQVERFGMRKMFDIFNMICLEDLGFQFDGNVILEGKEHGTDFTELKERVLNDILSLEFSEKEKGGFLRRAVFKYRRRKANAWKHELCFNESMSSAFWSGAWNHLLKPKSI